MLNIIKILVRDFPNSLLNFRVHLQSLLHRLIYLAVIILIFDFPSYFARHPLDFINLTRLLYTAILLIINFQLISKLISVFVIANPRDYKK